MRRRINLLQSRPPRESTESRHVNSYIWHGRNFAILFKCPGHGDDYDLVRM